MTRSTAILIIGYNRPEKVEAKLRLLEPVFKDELIVSIDGDVNRNIALSTKWASVSLLFPNVRWRFHQENLGLVRHCTGSISEVFKEFDNCIVLEDDVEVSVAFLTSMMQILATRLPKNALTIGSFGGVPSLWPISKVIKNRWRLSDYFAAWGWAIQSEDWAYFSVDIASRYSRNLNLAIHEKFKGYKKKVWMRRANVVRSNKYATYDFQIFFLGLLLNKKHILPTFRSSENIGFLDSRSTHTKHKKPFWYIGQSAIDIDGPKMLEEEPRTSKLLHIVDSITWAGDSYLNRIIQLLNWIKKTIK